MGRWPSWLRNGRAPGRRAGNHGRALIRRALPTDRGAEADFRCPEGSRHTLLATGGRERVDEASVPHGLVQGEVVRVCETDEEKKVSARRY